MVWSVFVDGYRNHPKIIAVGPLAAWLHTCAIQHCNEHLTDGYISKNVVPTLAPGIEQYVASVFELVPLLEREKLWESLTPTSWIIHDFFERGINKPRAWWEQRRTRDRVRKREQRQRQSVSHGDKNSLSHVESAAIHSIPWTDQDQDLDTSLSLDPSGSVPRARAHARDGRTDGSRNLTRESKGAALAIEAYTPSPEIVAAAREQGLTDSVIGRALGTMRKTARKRVDTAAAFDARFQGYLERTAREQPELVSAPVAKVAPVSVVASVAAAVAGERWSGAYGRKMFGDAYDDIDWERDV